MCTLTGDLLSGLVGRVEGSFVPAFGSCRQSIYSLLSSHVGPFHCIYHFSQVFVSCIAYLMFESFSIESKEAEKY